MNGMQYHLTVLQPFARDPAYYASVRTDESDTPAEEGPTIHGAIRLWQYPIWPRTVLDVPRALSASESARLTAQLRTIPPLLQQARANLAGSNARDLWVGGVRAFEEQDEALEALRARVASLNASDRALRGAIDDARTATVAVRANGCAPRRPSKTGPSGIGKAQYTWFLTQRAARAALVGGRGHHHAPRAGALARLAAAGGERATATCRPCRWPTRRRGFAALQERVDRRAT